ncbi:tenascin-X-like [Liolophura sinensis]|uniref:tenascin-X-like n=1 Tax=Liolophura sinensis TaxID=3198878 RepID=UPI003158E681
MNGIIRILQLQLLFVVSCCGGLPVTSVTETTITLAWSAGNYVNFTINYSGEDGLNYTTVVPVSGDNVTATIDDNLEAGQLYTIDIRGHTSSGDTSSVVPVFSQATKPNPPTYVTVTSAETHSLKVVWLEENDAVSSYVVRYKDLTNDSALMLERSVNDTSLNLTQLQPGHTYSISIAAVYYGVESNQTMPITNNTVPLPPVKVTVRALNESALYVMWYPDSSSTQVSDRLIRTC